jgi:PAS domain S-box-containing protein
VGVDESGYSEALSGYRRRLLGYFLAAAALIFFFAAAYYRSYRASLERDTRAMLAAAHQFKLEQIAYWRQDRLSDAASLLDSPFISAWLERLAAAPADKEALEKLAVRLDSFIRHNDYAAAGLYDRSGRPVLLRGNRRQGPGQEAARLIRGQRPGEKPAMTDLSAHGDGLPVFEIVAPAASAGKGLSLLLVGDPELYLYPLLGVWSSAGRTGELVLARMEGGEGIYISKLRKAPGSALRRRLDLDKSGTVTAAALLSKGPAYLRGADYAGHKVVAYAGPVPETGWVLLAKMDEAEAFEGARWVKLLIVLLALVLICLAGLAAYLLAYRHAAGLYLELEAARRDAEKNRLNFDRLAELANDIFLVAGAPEGSLLYANRKACEAYGLSGRELTGRRLEELVAPDKLQELRLRFEALCGGGRDSYESVHRRADGSLFPVEVSAAGVEISGRRYVYLICRDVTGRRRNEAINAARTHLLKYSVSHSLDELLEETINEAEKLTGSSIGFYHFVEPDQQTLSLQNWSRRTKAEFCKAEGKGLHYAVGKAGVWVDCVQTRGPVIHNDYASLPHRKGLPPGHAAVSRELVVPVLRGDKITAILGVGNKPSDYDQEDVKAVSLLADLAWEIAERKRAEEALAENEERFHSIYDSVSDAVLLIDGASCVEANAAAVSMFGCSSREQLLGATLADFSPEKQPDGSDSMQAGGAYAATALREGSARFQWRHRRRSGEAIDAEVSLTVARLRGRKYLLAVIRDITESLRAREKLAAAEKAVRNKLDAVLNPGSDLAALELADLIDAEKVQALMDKFYALTKMGIGIIDMKGRVLVGTGWQEICTKFHRGNPETCKLCVESDLQLSTGVPAGTFKAYKCRNNMWDIVTPIMLGGTQVGNIFLGQFLYEDEVPDKEVFRAQARRHGFEEKAYLAALDAVPRWNRVTVEAAMSFYAAFAETFGHLSYSNIRLARALEERNRAQRALEQTARELREKNLELEDFIYTVSHDLRSPLVNIQGFADMLGHNFEELRAAHSGARAEELLREAIPDGLRFVTSGAVRMNELISSLLKVARLGRQEVSAVRVDMNALLAGLLASMKYQFEEAGADVAAGPLPGCLADKDMAAQLFSNLIDNALKYRSPDRKLALRISGAERDGRAVYRVADNGCGLNSEELSGRIWKLFYRARPEGPVKGEGIGLTVCKRIAERNGGGIKAEAAEGGGTVFTVELPAAGD